MASCPESTTDYLCEDVSCLEIERGQKAAPVRCTVLCESTVKVFVEGLRPLCLSCTPSDLDKLVVGHLLLNRIDPARTAVFSSGRIPIDMAIKAIRAKIPLFATKAAPTQQAIQIARHYGLVLVCLGKNGRLQVFSGEEALVS